jgi:hypothetical protein
MSAPCESRQFSHLRALAEALAGASGREFHLSGGNWLNNPPELRPRRPCPQNTDGPAIQANVGRRAGCRIALIP